uniref:Uncharacterized protein n=1 Tax=Anguilla anguilla TaxID=7936 RepID=A0A0E9V199_ANGAN
MPDYVITKIAAGRLVTGAFGFIDVTV